MVLNPEKKVMCLGEDIDDTETLSFNDLTLKNSKEGEILGITLDRSIGFNTHMKSRPETKLSIKNQSLP